MSAANYLEYQKELIDKLRERGIYYTYRDRLSLFWLRSCLPSLVAHDDWLDEVIQMLDDLTVLRREGQEPKHENGVYV